MSDIRFFVTIELKFDADGRNIISDWLLQISYCFQMMEYSKHPALNRIIHIVLNKLPFYLALLLGFSYCRNKSPSRPPPFLRTYFAPNQTPLVIIKAQISFDSEIKAEILCLQLQLPNIAYMLVFVWSHLQFWCQLLVWSSQNNQPSN